MLTASADSFHYYPVRDEHIADSKLPEYAMSDKDKFEDALRLLAKMIAKDILRKQAATQQNASSQTKKEE
jgi:hypothetical protein